MPTKIEWCDECGEPTGNAGRYDGSLFPVLISGDEVGPLCWTCYEEYRGYGLILED